MSHQKASHTQKKKTIAVWETIGPESRHSHCFNKKKKMRTTITLELPSIGQKERSLSSIITLTSCRHNGHSPPFFFF